MPNTPNYGFNRKPRFSVNQIADYLSATTADQRENVIRAAKFPRKTAVVPYSGSKRTMRQFMGSNTGDLSYFDRPIRLLETRLRNEPEGWTRDEIQRDLNAFEAFKKAFTKSRVKKYTFGPGPTDMTMRLESVAINARLDASVTETDGEGVTYCGGCVMFIASTDAARRKIDDRRKAVAALVHWGLESSGGNIEPLPRLCMCFDVFGGVITKAPAAIDRLRSNVRTSCREAAASWDGVGPPTGYDGPDWQ